MSTGDRRPSLAAFALAAAALAAAPTAALADVVGMPPTDCPAGTRGSSSHCGEYCYAPRCSDDLDCEEGETCEVRELCVVTLRCESSGGPYSQEAVEGTCEGGGACSDGSCESVRVCVDESESGYRAASCQCSAAGAGRAPLLAAGALLLALVGLALARRR